MFEPNELINMFASIAMAIYIVYLRKSKYYWPNKIWFVGVMLFTFSNIATVAEGFFYPVILNILEHLFLTLACLSFFIGAISIKSKAESTS